MIPTVGLIVAVYAIARLVQVPLEAWETKLRWWSLAVSVPATRDPRNRDSRRGTGDIRAVRRIAAGREEDTEWMNRLHKYIVASGAPCERVTSAVQQGIQSDGTNLWHVTCGAAAYRVEFKSGSTPRVREWSR